MYDILKTIRKPEKPGQVTIAHTISQMRTLKLRDVDLAGEYKGRDSSSVSSLSHLTVHVIVTFVKRM